MNRPNRIGMFLEVEEGGKGVPLSLSNLFDISSQFFVVEKVGLSSVLVENYCTSLMSNFLIR